MKKEKFDWNIWARLMADANSSAKKHTAILGIKFSTSRLLAKEFIPFATTAGPLTGIEFESTTPTVTTSARIESTILRAFSKTNYESLENKSNITLGRYIIAPSKLPLHILQKTFDYIFENKSKRISKSWLKPLQDLILSKQISLEKRKINLENASYSAEELDEQINDLEYPDPFARPKLRQFVSGRTYKSRPIPEKGGAIVGGTISKTSSNESRFPAKSDPLSKYLQDLMLKKEQILLKTKGVPKDYWETLEVGSPGIKQPPQPPQDINAGSKEEWKK